MATTAHSFTARSLLSSFREVDSLPQLLQITVKRSRDPCHHRTAVTNEFHLSNVRGTVAMAKLDGNPNSATSDWFVNLANNSANLDHANGGFTVFGSVIRGMAVVDAIAALPRIRTTGEGIPVRNFTPGVNATPANLINVTMVRLFPKTDFSGDFKPDIILQNNSTGQPQSG